MAITPENIAQVTVKKALEDTNPYVLIMRVINDFIYTPEVIMAIENEMEKQGLEILWTPIKI